MRKKRVLYIHNSEQIGGGNKILLGLFSALDKSKYEPYSMIPRRGPLEIELKKVSVPYIIMDVISPSISGKLFNQVFAILRFFLITIKGRFDVIHAQGPMTYRIPSVVKKITRCKYVCHLHFPASINTNLRWAFRVVPDALIACSSFVAETYRRVLTNGTAEVPRLEIVPNFIDMETFNRNWTPGKIREELGIGESDHVVSIIGLVSERKGHPEFLEMAKLLRCQFSNVYFLIVGDDILQNGKYLEEMKLLAQRIRITDRVFFLGFRNDVANIINDSNVIVLPSHAEGMPVSLLEAAACSKPVVAYKIPGVDEVVTDGKTGYLVEESNVYALAQAVKKILVSRALAEQLGRNAKEIVQKRFNLEVFTKRIERIYDTI